MGNIIKLLSGGRRLKKFWDGLDVALHESCAIELARDPSLHQGSLFLRLRDRFTLQPVEFGRLQSVTISAAPITYSDDGVEVPGFRASARVTCSGSKELLQTQPEPGFQFAFRGSKTKHAVLLHKYLPDMDARAFAQAVQQELARTRPVLDAFRPTVLEYDTRLRELIEAKIRTY